MKLSTILIAAATLLTAITFSIDEASASERQARVDKRQKMQRKRIRSGAKSGELTHKETKRLAKDQRHTRRMERRFKKDGDFNKKERLRLENAQDQASKRIVHARHNTKRKAHARRKHNAENNEE